MGTNKLLFFFLVEGEYSCNVVANVLDYNILFCEFKLQPQYYIHFRTNTLGKGINLLIPPAMG